LPSTWLIPGKAFWSMPAEIVFEVIYGSQFV
jgi:hypothetical protein